MPLEQVGGCCCGWVGSGFCFCGTESCWRFLCFERCHHACTISCTSLPTAHASPGVSHARPALPVCAALAGGGAAGGRSRPSGPLRGGSGGGGGRAAGSGRQASGASQAPHLCALRRAAGAAGGAAAGGAEHHHVHLRQNAAAWWVGGCCRADFCRLGRRGGRHACASCWLPAAGECAWLQMCL